ncbi:Deoxyhypusine synthase-domain-containing protein, partial [Ampelomyces quisqualis]
TSAMDSSVTDAVLKPSAPVAPGSREVQGIDFNQHASRNITVDELVGGYATMGFQATSVGEAVRIINDMRAWKDPESDARTTIFLGYTSNLISSGLRETLRYLVQHKHVAAIVTTAGGVEEDLIKCLAPTYLGAFSTPGAGLRQKGMNRIGNLVVPNSNYCAFEDWVVPILDTMLAEQEASRKTDEPLHWTPSKVIQRLGKEINDERSVYYWAWKNDIPVFCPALTDGSLGDMLYFHTFKASPEQLRIDIVEDIRKLNTIAVRAKRTGMIVLGGGLVKHHIANANLMRNGAESAVYINTAQEFDGSDAGARPDEAVSWGKIKVDGESVKVYAEATVAFPLIVAATFARVQPHSAAQVELNDNNNNNGRHGLAPWADEMTQGGCQRAKCDGEGAARPGTHQLHAQTPASLSPLPPARVDMSSSITTPAPAGQQHDRDDADMEDSTSLTNSQAADAHPLPANRESSSNPVAVEAAAVDQDAMDTTPDADTDLLVQPGPADSVNASAAPASLTANGASGEQTSDPNAQPPPPPPPLDPVRSDSDSSDDDDGLQPWHAIQEDTSLPDEAELKEIEARTEHSALDHEYWESNAFLPLGEPEYTAGETGRINWSIDAYNGTREKPNRDIVMTSDVVTVGGHQWQIKLYPKGNDSDYLSVYLECLSVMHPKKKSEEERDTASNKTDAPTSEDTERKEVEIGRGVAEAPPSPLKVPVNPQHAPIPLLGSKAVAKRKCVAAQVSVVLYNPTEPRVNYSRTALHRFCSGSPDWGWTRFHGPYYDIAHRMHGQRSALLRDDKLAFTGYIRIVDDETNCLWEHPNRENPWDSFAMTGLQSLMLGKDASAPGGNMISAVASWLLFKPFRKLLYRVLYMLRTQVEPGAGPVALDDVLDALEWYGIHDRLDQLDVIEVWEVLRSRLDEELRDTAQADLLETLFGPKRNYATGVPTYRVPVVGVETMQAAINNATRLMVSEQPLPQMLTIELDRQVFDVKTRSYVKVLNKVTLDDHLTIDSTAYTLYGFVVHKQTLQSYVYQPVLRPEGPDTRWYSYSDSKDNNQVRCLPKRRAVDEHEGKTSKEQIVGNDPVAYIAMYIRDDVAQAAFTSDPETEQWVVPEWLRAEVEKDKNSPSSPPMLPAQVDVLLVDEYSNEKPKKSEDKPLGLLDFLVIDSRAFNEHEGPGNIDAYDKRWMPGGGEYVHSVQLAITSRNNEIVEKLATLFPDIKDTRQILFWFIEPSHGSLGRPRFLGTGKTQYSRGNYDRYTENKDWTLADSPCSGRRIWVHIIDVADLPELPAPQDTKVEGQKPDSEDLATDSNVANEMHAETTHVETEPVRSAMPDSAPRTEDTPMSEPGDPTGVPVETQVPMVDATPATTQDAEASDTAMVEVESAVVPDPPPVDVLISEEPIAPGDTEMGGTQNHPSLPPPPPAQILDELAQPPPPERARTPDPPPDEIYFFLKLWNPEKQALESRGSYLSLMSARVDETVTKLLGLPTEDKKKLELWEEEHPTNARPIKHRRSFAQLDLRNTAIIIAALPTMPEQRTALADGAAFVDPSAYLVYRAFARNFPASLNGHFTYTYFSSEHYKGEVKNGHRHGHGTLIYHSGATYSGSFRLGQCHGHGLYTFQNGDTYDGDWVNGQQHGSGTFVEAATGNTYVGGWKNDKKFGEGVTHWKNAQEAERLCRICWDEAAEAAFYDCGHVVACLTCAREVQNCPVCRKRVLSAMKLYYVA